MTIGSPSRPHWLDPVLALAMSALIAIAAVQLIVKALAPCAAESSTSMTIDQQRTAAMGIHTRGPSG